MSFVTKATDSLPSLKDEVSRGTFLYWALGTAFLLDGEKGEEKHAVEISGYWLLVVIFIIHGPDSGYLTLKTSGCCFASNWKAFRFFWKTGIKCVWYRKRQILQFIERTISGVLANPTPYHHDWSILGLVTFKKEMIIV